MSKKNEKELERLVKLYFYTAPIPHDKHAYSLVPEFATEKNEAGKSERVVKIYLSQNSLRKTRSLENSAPVFVTLPLDAVVAALPGEGVPAPYLQSYVLSLLDAALFTFLADIETVDERTQPAMALLWNYCGAADDAREVNMNNAEVTVKVSEIIVQAVQAATYPLRHRLDGAQPRLAIVAFTSEEMAKDMLSKCGVDRDYYFDFDVGLDPARFVFNQTPIGFASTMTVDVGGDEPVRLSCVVPFFVGVVCPRIIASKLFQGLTDALEQLA